MFTLSFVSSFLGLEKLLRSYSKPKKLLKKVHVNVPLSQALRGQSQRPVQGNGRLEFGFWRPEQGIWWPEPCPGRPGSDLWRTDPGPLRLKLKIQRLRPPKALLRRLPCLHLNTSQPPKRQAKGITSCLWANSFASSSLIWNFNASREPP